MTPSLDRALAWVETLPFASASAAAFYLALVLVAASPALRGWLGARLSMPVPSTHSYLAPLDAFRGLAALYIATFHAWQWPEPLFNATAHQLAFIQRGAKAVPMFVIMSGFLIYRSLRDVASIQGIQHYLLRRFLRIFPLYAATVLALLVLHKHHGDGSFLIQRFIAEAFMVRSLEYPMFMNPPVWSLYVEVVFYLLLPLYLIAAGRRVVAATAAAFVVFAMTDPFGPRELMLWKYFCVGILACVAVDRWRGRVKEGAALALFAVGAGLLVVDIGEYGDWVGWLLSKAMAAAGLQYRTELANPALTVGLGLGMGLVVFGATCARSLNRVFTIRPLHILGVISYSVFMWHSFVVTADLPLAFDAKGGLAKLGVLPDGPASALIVPLVMVPAVLFWSAVSFLCVERPFLMRRPKTD
jgi:peptidoglycan/LPS O-acetylase OafA/YrhL